MLQEPQSPRDDELAAESAEEADAQRLCPRCNMHKPLSHFMKRTGKRSSKNARRGMCRACRKKTKKLRRPTAQENHLPEQSAAPAAGNPASAADAVRRTLAGADGSMSAAAPGAPEEEYPLQLPMRRLSRRPLPEPPPKPPGPDASVLRPTREGIIRMRGHTDKGRRWVQETDLETASVLVREFAAVVVNAHTIRRLYSNKKFKRYILMRDQYTCYFCGEYGDTIDHLLPRSRGGHTTPMNCVCACSLCNQSKANRSLEDFMEGIEE
ncbi:HNH endonuclease [Paenibacillus sp. YN15]|uniref:HNH endonuclease n=1 Tax=Paenibacillus sp. YN15 TaxID=1742774 RepID=UPI000DCE44E4|nr:HNH endonuclease [Paenibacillus sp. YN15]RAU99543.1 HNH endonuclease [Paenibacillus sp. YN15]